MAKKMVKKKKKAVKSTGETDDVQADEFVPDSPNDIADDAEEEEDAAEEDDPLLQYEAAELEAVGEARARACL